MKSTPALLSVYLIASFSLTARAEVPPTNEALAASVGRDGEPLAGYHGGLFYLRDESDNYRLYVQGRAHVDFYSYAGPGVSNTTLKPTLFLRRARPEISGEFFKRWIFDRRRIGAAWQIKPQKASLKRSGVWVSFSYHSWPEYDRVGAWP